ncbi:MAG: prolyl oligopeptidase family serine peptidase [Planctomycetes bacterium]|nr:prolyl oligopeptidase family serine peptidase [Planctomycetota bacterium]
MLPLTLTAAALLLAPASRPQTQPATAPVELRGAAPFRGWIDYPSSDGLTIHAYLRKPGGAGPFKLFVYIPGGGKGAPIVAQDSTLESLGRYEPFLKAGYIVLVPAYRGAAGFGPAYQAAFDYAGREVDDVAEAVLLLTRSGLIDERHVYLSGVSHGAKISVIIAERYRLATAIAPIAGDYDIASAVAGIKVPGYCNALLPPARVPVMRESILKQHPGLSDEQMVAEARRRDPLLNVRDIACPVFLITGGQDHVVGHYVAARMKQELARQHKTFIDKLYRGPGSHHGLPTADGPAADELWQDLLAFCENRPVAGTGTIPLAALEPDYPHPRRPPQRRCSDRSPAATARD